jgi:hypothetical protein
MINRLNSYTTIPFFEAIKNPEIGVCSYLTKKNHHNGKYGYFSAKANGHTNWNFTKIDHIFIGTTDNEEIKANEEIT